MKYYFAGERVLTREAAITQGGGHLGAHKYIQNRLLSYYYHGFLDPANVPTVEARESADMGWDMFLDSGAFTAYTKKKEITPERFAEYIHNSGDMWHVVASLDAIGDAEQSWRNLELLEELGCAVCPVFHADEPWYFLDRMVERYEYVFLGGMVGSTRAKLQAWLDKCWGEHLVNQDGTAKCKVHGFGLTDMVLTQRYPWHSIDSSSWLMTGVFGSCMFWTATGPRKVTFSDEAPDKRKRNSWHYFNLPPQQQRIVDEWLDACGVTAEQCAVHYSYRDTVNAKFYSELQDHHHTERFEPRGMTLWD
jgi:hypothetical protein